MNRARKLDFERRGGIISGLDLIIMLRALKDGELSAVEVNDGEPIMGNYHRSAAAPLISWLHEEGKVKW